MWNNLQCFYTFHKKLSAIVARELFDFSSDEINETQRNSI